MKKPPSRVVFESVEKQVFQQFGSGLRPGFADFMRKIDGLRCFFAALLLEKTIEKRKSPTMVGLFRQAENHPLGWFFNRQENGSSWV